MGKIVRHFMVRRIRGARGGKNNIGPYAAFFFIALAVGTAALSLWLEDRYRKADAVYRLYVAQHPLMPGEKPPRVDWLTGRIAR